MGTLARNELRVFLDDFEHVLSTWLLIIYSIKYVIQMSFMVTLSKFPYNYYYCLASLVEFEYVLTAGICTCIVILAWDFLLCFSFKTKVRTI